MKKYNGYVTIKFLAKMCDDQIRMGEKREQEKENSEAPQRNMKKKSGRKQKEKKENSQS